MVINVAHRFYKGGLAPSSQDEANFVQILHDDGTNAIYAHLQMDSIRVRPGRHVARGEYIANSGNTGFSSGPHLHFAVLRNAGMRSVSVPVTFAGPGREVVVPHYRLPAHRVLIRDSVVARRHAASRRGSPTYLRPRWSPSRYHDRRTVPTPRCLVGCGSRIDGIAESSRLPSARVPATSNCGDGGLLRGWDTTASTRRLATHRGIGEPAFGPGVSWAETTPEQSQVDVAGTPKS